MRSPRLLLILAICAVPRVAVADVPGPRPVCDAEGRGCKECWRPDVREDDPGFATCQSAAKAKGLVEACAHRQGAGEAVFFCPTGERVETKIVGGGCAGCSIGADAGPGAVAAIVVGLGALARRRRRSPK